MYAIAFDPDTTATWKAHPKGLTQAYADIRRLVADYGFEWRQGSVYTCEVEDFGNLFDTMKALPWFPDSVRDIRAFKVEQWSDFTSIMKR